jgi:hypothetical protein
MTGFILPIQGAAISKPTWSFGCKRGRPMCDDLAVSGSQKTRLLAGPRVQLASNSEKIPETREFNNMFGRQNGSNYFRLRSRMYFIEMMLGHGFGHELPDAFVESAIDN